MSSSLSQNDEITPSATTTTTTTATTTTTTTKTNTPVTLPEAGSSAFKLKYKKPTPSARIQSQTETECAPFFIDIANLPKSSIRDIIRISLIDPQSYNVLLLRDKHVAYLQKPLQSKTEYKLPSGYLSLDASKTWILYWTLHALDLLDNLPDVRVLKGIVHTIEACWSDVKVKTRGIGGGGFGGGVGQMPHCATTYAAVMALSIIAGCSDDKHEEARILALDLLERKRMDLLKWYVTLRYEKQVDHPYHHNDDDEEVKISCGYRMHHDGEVDVRATFCICAVASLLNILTDELKNGMVEHIISCQTYEGGFGGDEGLEAHGGYTFCALSALHILVKDSVGTGTSTGTGAYKSSSLLSHCGVDTESLEDWLVKRQLGYEGGFSGRTNKLVDGCYTFWVGSAIAILDLDRVPPTTSQSASTTEACKNLIKFDSGIYGGSDYDPLGVQRQTNIYEEEITNTTTTTTTTTNYAGNDNLTFDQNLLQRYVLLCAQDSNGGLRDKPSKPRDFYHSCYNLSGLSVSQHVLGGSSGVGNDANAISSSGENKGDNHIHLYQNEEKNILGATHPVYNIKIERVRVMIRNFILS